MPTIDAQRASRRLAALFKLAEVEYAQNPEPKGDAQDILNASRLFESNTQSYREALLGCCIASLMDESINLRLPYVSQGETAYGGRALDEEVINPFLHKKEIPSSKGPFLATFRRNVRFTDETRSGLRDKVGYDAMLAYITKLEGADRKGRIELTKLLIHHFLQLRQKSNVSLARIARLSLDQQRYLVQELLKSQSGGLIPVLLAVAVFKTLNDCHSLGWEVEWQGINVADNARGVGGDITIKKEGHTHLAVEVTERVVERSRVVSTFNTKIAKNDIRDYLFLITRTPENGATEAAKQYFGQGHDINFLNIENWVSQILGTIGVECRKAFTNNLIELLDLATTPASVKVRWNTLIQSLVH